MKRVSGAILTQHTGWKRGDLYWQVAHYTITSIIHLPPVLKKVIINIPQPSRVAAADALRKQLSYLKRFIESFDFLNMRPDSTTITGGLPANALAQTLSEAGKQYAIYLYRGEKVNLELLLPPGNYEVEWLNTLTGNYYGKTLIKHKRVRQP